jgi:hypothetical protein
MAALTALTAVSPPPKWNTALDADQSADFLAAKLQAQDPFIYIRFGDADILWMGGGFEPTCDGEYPSPGIGIELEAALDSLLKLPHFYLGDVESFSDPASLRVRQLFQTYCDHYENINFLHHEALLLHRKSESLQRFYRALRHDPRRKILVGPQRLNNAMAMLNIDCQYEVSATQANEYAVDLAHGLANVEWDILLTCCGRTSKIIAGILGPQFPDRTIIELGSALDPLFVGQTRSGQLPMAEARDLLKDLL